MVLFSIEPIGNCLEAETLLDVEFKDVLNDLHAVRMPEDEPRPVSL